MSTISLSEDQQNTLAHSVINARDEAKLTKALLGCNVDSLADLPEALRTKILHRSVAWGSRRVTEHLLDQNIAPDAQDCNGNTALKVAVMHAGNEAQNDPHLFDGSNGTLQDQLPYLFARQALDTVENVELLLERGADPSIQSTFDAPSHCTSVLDVVQAPAYLHEEVKKLILDSVATLPPLSPPRSTNSFCSTATLTAATVAVVSVGLYCYSNYLACREEQGTSVNCFGEMFG